MDASTSAAVAAWAACASAVVTLITVCVTAWFARKQVEAARAQVQAAHETRLQQDRHAQEALAAQARLAQETLEHEAREAQKTREEQSQPNVVMFMESNATHWYALELVVKNFGATPAYNIEMEFNPKPQVCPRPGSTDPTDLWIPAAIPILAPGQEWRTLWDMSNRRFKHGELPSRHEATVTYTNSGGSEFTTQAVLDWDSLRDTRAVTVKTLHNVAENIHKQNEHLKAISQQLARFSSPTSGVWVFGSDGIQELTVRNQQAEESQRQFEDSIRALEEQEASASPTDDQTAGPHSTEAQPPEQA
ncbi:hypothetical protein ACFWVM_18235 [Nocardia fluminea]|uniref:hypothetical protein n=1 Tax=Nocardia fluminea TaxID=134984 RepID=UPI003654849D